MHDLEESDKITFSSLTYFIKKESLPITQFDVFTKENEILFAHLSDNRHEILASLCIGPNMEFSLGLRGRILNPNILNQLIEKKSKIESFTQLWNILAALKSLLNKGKPPASCKLCFMFVL
jgi:hypothetical protein